MINFRDAEKYKKPGMDYRFIRQDHLGEREDWKPVLDKGEKVIVMDSVLCEKPLPKPEKKPEKKIEEKPKE